MSSSIDDNGRPFGGHDSEDITSKKDIEANAVNSVGVVEQHRDVPNVHQQNNEGCSEQDDAQQLQKHQKITETKNKDTVVSSAISDCSTDAVDKYKNNTDESEKDQDIPENNTDDNNTQIESTYFGSPKKLSTSNVVKEITSSLSEVQTTNIPKSIETSYGRLDHPTPTQPKDLSAPQQPSNGLSISDVVPQVIKAHPRGILKNTKSEPVIIISEPIEKLKHSDSTGLIETSRPTWPKYGKRKFLNVSTSANYFRTSQEFVNPAFELDENITSDSKLSDIVELVMKQQTDQNRYVHPFGQSNLYTSMFLDDTPASMQNTERVVFWLIFVIMLVGLAGAIILMAEMYRLEMLETQSLNSTAVSS